MQLRITINAVETIGANSIGSVTTVEKQATSKTLVGLKVEDRPEKDLVLRKVKQITVMAKDMHRTLSVRKAPRQEVSFLILVVRTKWLDQICNIRSQTSRK